VEIVTEMVMRMPRETLTSREHEVLLEIIRGRSNAEIGRELYVAEKTVKTHVTRILRKLDLRDRVAVVIYAYESGIVEPRVAASIR
jgi:DNA-binding NarL/FixJ family response regulator